MRDERVAITVARARVAEARARWFAIVEASGTGFGMAEQIEQQEADARQAMIDADLALYRLTGA